MSQLKVNQVSAYSGNTITLGTSGNTITIPANVTFNALNANVSLPSSVIKLDAITATNTSTYNLTYNSAAYSPPSTASCIVSLNGVIQEPTDAYTISGSTITFSNALTSTDTIDFISVLAAPLTVNVPGSATVGLAQLSATGTASSSTFLRGDNSWSQVGLTTGVTGTLPIANGGTNLTTYTTGDLLYASNATTLTKLAIGSSGQGLVVSGGIPAWGTSGPSAGQVIQVVSARDSTQRSTSSGSFVTASNTLSVTITPSSSANSIYLICTTQFYAPTGYFTIYRNGSTNLGDATYGLGMATDGDLGVRAPGAISYYDSPATTSATTYQVYIKGNPGAGQSGFVNYNNVPGTIMAFEVKG